MYTENQTYTTLKEHMIHAFELRLHIGTVGSQTTAYNAYGNNNDLMGTITESLVSMQLANNAVATAISVNMSEITRKTAELQAIIEQMKQECANNTYNPWQPLPPREEPTRSEERRGLFPCR